MRKTGGEIERDIYDLVKSKLSGLTPALSGSIYRKGLRPKDSVFEDAVLSFMTGLPGQFEVGYLNLNVYVPNIEFNSVFVCDITRCTQIESFLNAMILSIDSIEYELSLSSTIQTFDETSINQHFVNCKIKYKRTIL